METATVTAKSVSGYVSIPEKKGTTMKTEEVDTVKKPVAIDKAKKKAAASSKKEEGKTSKKAPKWFFENRVFGRFRQTAGMGKIADYFAQNAGKARTPKQVATATGEKVSFVEGRIQWLRTFGKQTGVFALAPSQKTEGAFFMKLKDTSEKALSKAQNWHTAEPAPKKKAKSVKKVAHKKAA